MQKTINSDLPVEIVEEREQIKAQLTPRLLLAVVKNVGIHHTDRIVHDFRTVGRPMEKPGKEEPWLTLNAYQMLTRHLLWNFTSTDGKRAAGYLGQV